MFRTKCLVFGTKGLVGMALFALLALSSLLAMPASAQVAPQGSSVDGALTKPQMVDGAAVTCYGQAFNFGPFTLEPDVYVYPSEPPWFTTSPYCSDINVKFSRLTAPIQMQVCFIRTGTCNSWKSISRENQWYVIATDVLDGTEYRFGIKTTETTTIQGAVAD